MNSGLRIAVITTSYPRTDRDEAGVFLKPLVEAFSALGMSGEVIVPKDIESETLSSTGGFRVRRVRYGLFTRGRLAFGAGIIPNLRARPFLIFQAPLLAAALAAGAFRARPHAVHANWVLAAVPALLVRLLLGTPYVLTLRGEDLRLLRNRFLRFLFGPAIGGAGAVVTVSEHLRSELSALSGRPIDRIEVIPNGVALPSISESDYASFLERHRWPSGEPVLLFVGTIIPRKNVRALIELLAAPAPAPFRLVLCGRIADQAEVARLKELALRLGCAERISWEGAVPPDLIPLYLRRADAYCSASNFEGRPNAAIEALAAGKIVCLSDIPAHREIVRDGMNGIIFDPAQPAALSGRITALLKDGAARAALESGARSSVKELSWSRSAERYLSVFMTIRQNRAL